MKTEKAVSVIVEKDNTISNIEESIIDNFKEKYGITPTVTVDFLFYYPEITITASVGEELSSLFSVNFDSEEKENNVYIDTYININESQRDRFNLEDLERKLVEFLESAPMKRLMSLYLGYHESY